jgi:hypothetical protein
VHLACSREYFETVVEVVDRALHFSPKLEAGERDELRRGAPIG